jgi:hypothetical protein
MALPCTTRNDMVFTYLCVQLVKWFKNEMYERSLATLLKRLAAECPPLWVEENVTPQTLCEFLCFESLWYTMWLEMNIDEPPWLVTLNITISICIYLGKWLQWETPAHLWWCKAHISKLRAHSVIFATWRFSTESSQSIKFVNCPHVVLTMLSSFVLPYNGIYFLYNIFKFKVCISWWQLQF